MTGYSSLPRSNHSADSRLETDINSAIPLETVAEDQEIKQRVGGTC